MGKQWGYWVDNFDGYPHEIPAKHRKNFGKFSPIPNGDFDGKIRYLTRGSDFQNGDNPFFHGGLFRKPIGYPHCGKRFEMFIRLPFCRLCSLSFLSLFLYDWNLSER